LQLLTGRTGPKKFVKYAPPIPNLLNYHLSDYGNAQRLIALHGPDLRYCPPFKKWMAWDDKRWATDTTGRARRLAALTMVEFLRQAVNSGATDKQGFASASLNSKGITSLLKVAEPE